MEEVKNTPTYTWEMSIREGEFEKALSLLDYIYSKINFSEKQDIVIRYRPKERTTITFMKAE